ncbi:hypothetical protein NGRA_0339 [Nosema granulosis]|uniref:Uncharacterized protein n=1 Tax=Nosema granulosis TaxID=83296 RepID=A0A9P6H1K7_9MICR|nr:hypothetical protein NGRA_0339 [Nosema granulosis]
MNVFRCFLHFCYVFGSFITETVTKNNCWKSLRNGAENENLYLSPEIQCFCSVERNENSTTTSQYPGNCFYENPKNVPIVEIKSQNHNFYQEKSQNIDTTLNDLSLTSSCDDLICLNEIISYCCIFNTLMTKKKFFKKCCKLKKIVENNKFKTNKNVSRQYIVQILYNPSRIDLFIFRKYPEMIGMFVDLLSKYERLSLEDILLVIAHFSVIKTNIHLTLAGVYNETTNIPLSIQLGRNYMFTEGLYIHVEEIYKILNDGANVFLTQYNQLLETLRDKTSSSKADVIINELKMITFMINPSSFNLIKTYFEESIFIDSRRCVFEMRNDECSVCCNIAQTLGYTYGLILGTLNKINQKGKFKFDISFWDRYSKAFNHINQYKGNIYAILKVNDIISIIYDMLNKRILQN